jgi:hypothetical protein
MNERRNPPFVNKSGEDLKLLPEDAEVSQIIDAYNDMVNSYNFLNKFISFQSNFDGYIVNVTLPATTRVDVQHFLGITPKFRVILRQEGNGVITDIPSGWNDKVIALYNNGAVQVKITVLIARE